MKTTTFETAKIGDKVWDIRLGWGEICDVCDVCDKNVYSVAARFPEDIINLYTVDGLSQQKYITQFLFWDEVVIEAPQKPLPELEVDTKVLVWVNDGQKAKRYFSHFTPQGRIVCFSNGLTSWITEQTSDWDNWELAE